MKFGDVPLGDAAGAILAHSIATGTGRLRKGHVLTAEDIAGLSAAGIESVVAVRLEKDDLGENTAAAEIAAACAGPGLDIGSAFTGRCNLTAAEAGIAMVAADPVNRLNAIDEAVTLATVRPFEAVTPGQIVATVKIITFGVARRVVDACVGAARDAAPLVRLAPYRPSRIALVQTSLPGLKPTLMDKALSVTRDRLAGLGATLAADRRCRHDADELSRTLAALRNDGIDIILVLGASAIADRRDVVPRAIESAGGKVEHFGMPVDPGNLMLLARLGDTRVLGLPGSARSPRLHGFDWVLQRLVAGIDVTGADIMRMGVGGLLKEIPSRPMPRDRTRPVAEVERSASRRVGGVILAAGQSRRMGAVNKLLAEIDGRPMVTIVADAVLASGAGPVVVVTGHEAGRVRAVLGGRKVRFVHNPDFAQGLSTSLKAGLAALPNEAEGAIVCLGDMPNVSASHLAALIAAFDPEHGRTICVPTHQGKRGNPVLWDRRYFQEIAAVAGDVGARHLIGVHPEAVHEVEMDDAGVLLDLDTPEALAAHLARGDD